MLGRQLSALRATENDWNNGAVRARKHRHTCSIQPVSKESGELRELGSREVICAYTLDVLQDVAGKNRRSRGGVDETSCLVPKPRSDEIIGADKSTLSAYRLPEGAHQYVGLNSVLTTNPRSVGSKDS